MKEMGAIFELFVEGNGFQVFSPSVQVVIDESYSVTVLSTHEQLMDGQVLTSFIL